MNAVYYQQLPGITKKDHIVREVSYGYQSLRDILSSQDVLPLIEQLEEDQKLLKLVKDISGDISESEPEEKEDDLALVRMKFDVACFYISFL